MKKRVRVYKPGGQTNQPTQEQIVNYIAQTMSADDYDGDTEALKNDLASAGIDEDVADEYIATVSDDLGLNQDTVSIEEQQRLAAEEEARAQEEEQALLEEQNAAEEARQQQLAAMYNTDIDMSTTEDTPEDEANYMKQGGSKLSKRSFIKEYTKFAKMGQGGDTPSPGADDVLNGREDLIKGFLGAVKNTANEAALKQAAEARYSIYQNGGVQQNQPDSENITHHMNAYATGVNDIFDNPQVGTNIDFNREQFGGFTDTDSGLYKFIGGGDNVSADEEYQDADLDYNQYAKGGFKMPKRSGRQYTQAVGSPYYTATGEAAVNPNLAGRQVTSVDVTKRGLLGRPKAYTVNYGNPNATAAGTTPQIKMPTEEEAKKLDAKAKTSTAPTDEYTPPNEFTGKRQPIANWMMRTGIPGISNLGARMIESNNFPITEDKKNSPEEAARVQEKYPNYKPFSPANNQQAIATQASSLIAQTGAPGAQNVQIGPSAKSAIPTGGFVDPSVVKSLQAYTDSKPYPKEQEAQINDIKLQDKAANDDMLNGVSRKAMNYDYGKDASAKAFQNKYPSFQGARTEEFWGQQQPAGTIKYSPEKGEKMRAMGLNPDTYGHHYLFENPNKLKEYGGPVDYTEYAYGGDVSIPELYRAQIGTEVGFDPNANNMSISNLQGYFDKAPTKDATGNQIQATVPESMQPKNITIDPNQPNKKVVTEQPDNLSQDYLSKKNWDKTRDNFALGSMAINAGLDTVDQVTANKQQNQMLEDITSAESNFGISNEDDRGDHDQAGNFRPDDTGFKDVSRYGGGVYATGGSIEDEDEDTLWMTQEEIDEFRANGGELEFY